MKRKTTARIGRFLRIARQRPRRGIRCRGITRRNINQTTSRPGYTSRSDFATNSDKTVSLQRYLSARAASSLYCRDSPSTSSSRLLATSRLTELSTDQDYLAMVDGATDALPRLRCASRGTFSEVKSINRSTTAFKSFVSRYTLSCSSAEVPRSRIV